MHDFFKGCETRWRESLKKLGLNTPYQNILKNLLSQFNSLNFSEIFFRENADIIIFVISITYNPLSINNCQL